MEMTHRFAYSWSGRPVRTHKESTCRETKRDMADLNIRMKSSRRGASNGGVQKIIFSFLGELFLKIGETLPKMFCTAQLDAPRRKL